MDLVFDYRKDFGEHRFYPVNEDACFITSLMEVRVLLPRHIKKMVEFGWNIQAEKLNIEKFIHNHESKDELTKT